jgi:aminopeptidase
MQKPYHPTQKVLEKYAKVLVNFALNDYKGIKKGEVVRITCPEAAKPLYIELKKAVIKSGGHVIGNYIPSDDEQFNLSKDFFQNASKDQIIFFPKKYLKALTDTIDHNITIIADTNLHALDGVDPKKVMLAGLSQKPMREWLNKKENAGKFTWTLGMYGTPAMAREARLSQKEYWGQIIKACFLNEKDPIKKWRHVYRDLENYRKKLNKITKNTDRWHIKGKDADLWITCGDKRAWMAGSGRNIPSFEIFTSPDWRGTEGWIRFNQPLYRYGNLIEDIQLWFKNGRVVKATATKNEKVLKEMIATENADKIGEFSMTDKRFSKITKFMAETLYDENVGGKYGNTHIALGNAYHDCYTGDPAKVTKAGWKKLGYNNSSVHTDVISTTDRTITAHQKDGSEIVLYKDGKYRF